MSHTCAALGRSSVSWTTSGLMTSCDTSPATSSFDRRGKSYDDLLKAGTDTSAKSPEDPVQSCDPSCDPGYESPGPDDDNVFQRIPTFRRQRTIRGRRSARIRSDSELVRSQSSRVVAYGLKSRSEGFSKVAKVAHQRLDDRHQIGVYGLGEHHLGNSGLLSDNCHHKCEDGTTESTASSVAPVDSSAGSYVALTLLGRPSGQQMSSTPIQAGSMPTQASSVTSQLPPPYPSHDGSPVNIVLPSSTGRGDDRSPLSGHSSGPKGEERTPISGPTAVDAQTDKELKMQKISMIRFMYEQACEECQKLAEELKNSSGSVSSQVQNKLDEKRRVCERLGDQLYLLTGIPTESHISSPKSPPSGLPPPGGTLVSPPGCQRPPLKRYSSGDGLNNIQEKKKKVPTATLR